MSEKNYQRTTIVFPVKNGEYLLGMKKRGFGAGWWNGYGGKLEPNESYEDSARRETFEEVGISVKGLKQIANLVFYNEDKVQVVSRAYLAEFEGEPEETEEMNPKFFKLSDFPFDDMWPGDDKWIPEVISGDNGVKDYEIYFDKDDKFIKIIHVKNEDIEDKF
jgi:8-oxo-dGTP pyrophosphatase MutT (NUDIX family)